MKRLFILLLSILMLSTATFGYENIDIIPDEIYGNTSTVYITYTLNYSFPVSNFTLNLVSEGIKFDNSSINIDYIEKNKKISGKIAGKITNKSMDKYDIIISKKYLINGLAVSSIMQYHLYRTNESENKLNKKSTPILDNNTVGSSNISDNITNNNTQITKNTKCIKNNTQNNIVELNTTGTKLSEINNSSSEYAHTVNKKPSKNNDINEGVNFTKNSEKSKNETLSMSYIFYGLLGLILGVLIAVVVVYLYDL